MIGDTDPKHTSLSGLELFQQLKDGQITPSPWAVLADLHVEDLGEGRAVLRATPDERHLNQIGLVHGGWVTTLMDSALGGAPRRTHGASAAKDARCGADKCGNTTRGGVRISGRMAVTVARYRLSPRHASRTPAPCCDGGSCSDTKSMTERAHCW